MEWLLFLSLLLPQNSIAREPIRIAVIDTGINLKTSTVKICKNGLFDLTGNGINDNIHHGQNVSHLIASHLEDMNYCMYIIKFTDREFSLADSNSRAFELAIKLNPDIVNFSAGGPIKEEREFNAIKKLGEMGITVVVAAGNTGKDLSKDCDYFPACYQLSNIVVVGSMNDNGTRTKSSNYGITDILAKGEKQTAGGYTMSGTSQACANATGMIVRRWLKK